jgi:hypothetical protein
MRIARTIPTTIWGDVNVRKYCLFVVAWLALAGALAQADDWPQWMGPNRDGTWNEKDIIERFPAGGPQELWRVPIAGGYSGPAVAGGKVFVTDYVWGAGNAANDFNAWSEVNGKERVLCLRASDGQLVAARARLPANFVSRGRGSARQRRKVYTRRGHLLFGS